MMASSPLQLAAFDLEKLRTGHLASSRLPPLPVGLPAIDEALPDGGLPRGTVIELCAPGGLARMTRFALSACASAQHGSEDEPTLASPKRWCAWVDSSRTLFAPGVAQAGVCLERLLVVQPEPRDMARIAVRLAASGVFSMLVIDRCGVPGSALPHAVAPRTSASTRRDTRPAANIRWSTAVRRLALAAQESETTILLLSRNAQATRDTLPTTMRIELGRPALERLSLRIAKDKRGRLQGPQSIPLLALHQRAG